MTRQNGCLCARWPQGRKSLFFKLWATIRNSKKVYRNEIELQRRLKCIQENGSLQSQNRMVLSFSLIEYLVPKQLASLTKEEAEGFFSNLGEILPAKPEMQRVPSKDLNLQELGGAVDHVSRNMNWNEGVEKIIKQNMLIGNLPGAVDCCLKCGRTVR